MSLAVVGAERATIVSLRAGRTNAGQRRDIAATLTALDGPFRGAVIVAGSLPDVDAWLHGHGFQPLALAILGQPLRPLLEGDLAVIGGTWLVPAHHPEVFPSAPSPPGGATAAPVRMPGAANAVVACSSIHATTAPLPQGA